MCAGDLPPLERVIVDNDESSIITSDSSESSYALTHTRNTIEYIAEDTLKNILEYDIVANPKTAGRLCAVCPAWNTCINDTTFTLRILAHNPTYYARHLKTAMCKQLNNNPTPAVKKHTHAVTVDRPVPVAGPHILVNANNDNDDQSYQNACLHPLCIIAAAGPGALIGAGVGIAISQYVSFSTNTIIASLGVGAFGGSLIWITIGGIRYFYADCTKPEIVHGGGRGHA